MKCLLLQWIRSQLSPQVKCARSAFDADTCGPLFQEFGKHGDQWHRLYAGMPGKAVTKINAVELKEPLAPYEMLCGLLVPLYAARATEEVFYGRRGVTLQTSREVRLLSGISGALYGSKLLY